jgi:hypothetical protein
MTIVLGLALLQGQSQSPEPFVLLGPPDSGPCFTVRFPEGHIVAEDHACGRMQGENSYYVRDSSGEMLATLSSADLAASTKWMQANSVLPRLLIKSKDLYWDGKKVNLGKVNVSKLYLAFPWQDGVFIYGRTFPRRGFFGSWPFKGHLIETRDIEPYCAIYFDRRTLKGEDAYLTGKISMPVAVYPVPR